MSKIVCSSSEMMSATLVYTDQPWETVISCEHAKNFKVDTSPTPVFSETHVLRTTCWVNSVHYHTAAMCNLIPCVLMAISGPIFLLSNVRSTSTSVQNEYVLRLRATGGPKAPKLQASSMCRSSHDQAHHVGDNFRCPNQALSQFDRCI